MKKQKPQEDKQEKEQEWPRPARVSRARQPQNRRLLLVNFSEVEAGTIGVRDNAFYRANEKVIVAKMSDGSLVDAKPKRKTGVWGGQE
jgi:hypothetical protein